MTTFRAKARAVELLGKGQIADLPTAITELWKNGYDAYATNLECKLFLESYKDNKKPLFLLSDNGFGMSENDILEKWFVLGTDSKARGDSINPHFGLEGRKPMGEKGIGRLSVAYLGSQMLMLSKKQGQKANGVFLDWRILENYDFYLSDLYIPTFSFDSIQDFNIKLSLSKLDFEGNLYKDNWNEQLNVQQDILRELKELIIPQFLLEEVISNFCLETYHGTSFVVFTPIDSLTLVSDKDRVEFKNSPSLNHLRASLSGLHNDLKNPIRDFETHFYVFDSAGKYDAINEFFTKDEMELADHWLKGEFDETGFFSGELRVFNKRIKYNFRPNRPPGVTSYGPFKIEWGSFEGNQGSSILNEEQFLVINEKLKTFGGLYIYRDDFRVLPYGRTEADFLEFEKRRSLGAGYYFFSHRRFIGYIDISRKGNPELNDKAGREGLIQNKAYREFKDDLISFFIDISVRYMRMFPEGEGESLRQAQIDEIKEKYERQLKAAKNKNNKTRKAFIDQLIENKKLILPIQNEISELENDLIKEVQNLQINYNKYNELIGTLEDKRTQIRNLKVQKPRGVTISKKQEEDYNLYQKEYSIIEDKVRSCTRIVEDTRGRLNVENLRLEFNEKFRNHGKNLEKRFSEYQNKVKESFNRIQILIVEEQGLQIDHFLERALSIRLNQEDSKEEISSKILVLERLTAEQNLEIDNSIGGFINHLSNLQIDVDDDFLRGWYQEQNENLKKKLSDYEELAQLGISIEIIDHQFNVMYSQMNDAMVDINRYSSFHQELSYSLKQFNTAFQHLESNYKLLRPLYRSGKKTREVIRGSDLERYIKDFFSNEFNRFSIDFTVNEAFREFEFFTYDSILKPVFLNLIDNANYWLTSVNKKQIRIEILENSVLIMNSGEPIDDSYLEDIFTLFFTRKKNGRGIGLYLAKKNLNSIGYEIHATNNKDYNKLGGACFIISKIQ